MSLGDVPRPELVGAFEWAVSVADLRIRHPDQYVELATNYVEILEWSLANSHERLSVIYRRPANELEREAVETTQTTIGGVEP